MSFEVELELDRVEAELSAELPGQLRALATAYAASAPAPSVPRRLGMRSTRVLAMRALAVPELATRALAMLRLVTPAAIEDAAAVAAARAAEPAWPAYATLSAARDAASSTSFQRPHLAWTQWLHGAGWLVPTILDGPAELAGWHAPSAPLAIADVERAWHLLAARHGARGHCRIVQAPVRPRLFVVEPGCEVIAVIGPLTTPALRFAALHELGHALAALLSPVALPRVLDEAAASYVARLVEHEGALDPVWFTPLAARARDPVRRTITTVLHGIEAGLRPPIARPPWSLWHDPGAQAAYVVAERFADHWWDRLGADPGVGAFAAELASQVAHVEQQQLVDRELTRAMQPQR